MRSKALFLLALSALLSTGLGVECKAGQTAKASRKAAAGCGVHCGSERWPVKTLSDRDHAKVNFTPQDTTVGWLVSQQRPHNPPANSRVSPIETQTYRVKAVLVGFKEETDRDFHIVIADPGNPQETMIVEIPDPGCAGACASGQTVTFDKARTTVTTRLGPAPNRFKRLGQPVPVIVTGVGFFDFKHGQTGLAKNAIELHPVLSIEFPADGPSILKGIATPQTQPAGNPDVKVWVNTRSGVYHCPGTRWYGNTKQGEYMT